MSCLPGSPFKASKTLKILRSEQRAETFGVTVKDIFWTQGRYDIVIVIDAPDELSATLLNLSLSALGNIPTESLRAFSSTDMLKIVAKML
jgi:uncharacterized protein with GYD domain